MTALTRIICGVSVLFGFALLLQINPWYIAMVLLSLLVFGILLACLWGIVIMYNYYNDKEINDKRNNDQ